MICDEFSSIIREKRRSYRFSQQTLAWSVSKIYGADVSRTLISRIEQGLCKNMTNKMVYAFCEVLKLDYNYMRNRIGKRDDRFDWCDSDDGVVPD